MNGGYALIDGTGIDLSVSTAQEVDTIYNRISAGMGAKKPLIFCGLHMGNAVLMTPIYGGAYLSGNNIIVLLAGKTLTVTSNNTVTVASSVAAAKTNVKGGK